MSTTVRHAPISAAIALALLAPFGLLASAARTTLARESVAFGDPLPDEMPAHLSFGLRLQDESGLAQLLRDQQDPASPQYRAWLTPEQFGDRFGVSEATYARIVSWLGAEGFTVVRYPNRLFVEGTGTTAGVRRLLGVRLRSGARGERVFRTVTETPSLPVDIAPLVVRIGGLDTRTHLRRRFAVAVGGQSTHALGADDLRTLYDFPQAGTGASGLTVVALGTQEGTQASEHGNPGPPFVPPSTDAIDAYLSTISGATAPYNPIVLPNPNDDFDTSGANQEYELDVEMLSVGAPNAQGLDLVLSPASEVFMTGAQYVANSLSGAVVVSTSLGDCEPAEVADEGGGANAPGSEASVLRLAVQQGTAEGQTWFAAAGDTGADACNDSMSGTGNGYGGGNATVEFPCSVPEVVCVGGTQFETPANWSSSGALTAWQAEVVWNGGAEQGATGGGESVLYGKPSWQSGVGPYATDGARDVPDIALMASDEDPGVVVYDCGNGQDRFSCGGGTTGAGPVDIAGGTSVGTPLAAGFFAQISGQLGCKLGDAHPVLYSLGSAQHDGGAQPFHDVTIGNNSYEDPGHLLITGFTAGPGYDLASGWGSFDLAKLIDSWPACMKAAGSTSTIGSMSGSGTPTVSSGCRATAGATPPAGIAGGLLVVGLLATFRRRHRC